jgi:PadR family transcriptional regulator PadR
MKMTAPLERVLRAFLADPSARRYGYDLMKAASLKSGTLYPLLGRLEQEKLVSSAWETPQQDGQRPRRGHRDGPAGTCAALRRPPGRAWPHART